MMTAYHQFPETTPMTERILITTAEFCETCRISRSTFYRLRASDADFPQCVEYGVRSVRYRLVDVNGYIESKLRPVAA